MRKLEFLCHKNSKFPPGKGVKSTFLEPECRVFYGIKNSKFQVTQSFTLKEFVWGKYPIKTLISGGSTTLSTSIVFFIHINSFQNIYLFFLKKKKKKKNPKYFSKARVHTTVDGPGSDRIDGIVCGMYDMKWVAFVEKYHCNSFHMVWSKILSRPRKTNF